MGLFGAMTAETLVLLFEHFASSVLEDGAAVSPALVTAKADEGARSPSVIVAAKAMRVGVDRLRRP